MASLQPPTAIKSPGQASRTCSSASVSGRNCAWHAPRAHWGDNNGSPHESTTPLQSAISLSSPILSYPTRWPPTPCQIGGGGSHRPCLTLPSLVATTLGPSPACGTTTAVPSALALTLTTTTTTTTTITQSLPPAASLSLAELQAHHKRHLLAASSSAASLTFPSRPCHAMPCFADPSSSVRLSMLLSYSSSPSARLCLPFIYPSPAPALLSSIKSSTCSLHLQSCPTHGRLKAWPWIQSSNHPHINCSALGCSACFEAHNADVSCHRRTLQRDLEPTRRRDLTRPLALQLVD
jgi:hypothetical protein